MTPYTTQGLFARTPVRLALWIALGVWFMGTWLSEPYLMGRGQDWAYFVHHATVATRSWTEYGQVPMWNPWFCGGIPALANIQTDALSPDLLLTLPFDQPVASALRLLLFIVIGLEGAWQYARHHGVHGWGAIIAAAAFMFSGRFMMIFWDGHLPFFGFALAPWVFYGLERSYERLRWGLVSAVALTWIFFNGGAVATPLIATMMGFLMARDVVERLVAPTEAMPRKAWYRPVVSMAFIGLFTLLLSLPRLVPVFQTLIDYPRPWDAPEAYSLGHVASMLFLPPDSWQYFASGTSYVGLGVGVACALAILWRARVMWKLVAAAVIAFDLAMGESGPLQTWKIMHTLPVVHDVRAAFRFTFLVALFVAIGAGRGIWWAELRIAERGAAFFERRNVRKWLAVAITSAVAGVVALVVGGHGPVATRQRLTEIPRLEVGPRAPGDFHQALGTRWIAQVWPRANLGSIACFEEQHFPQSAHLRGDRVAEEWLAEGEGDVRRLGWSPNEIDLAVDSKQGGVVAVNQNAARGWSTNVGTITDYRGLLAAKVPPGPHTLTFTYEEPGIVAWMGVSFATMLGIAGWWVFDWRRRRRSSLGVDPERA